MNKTIQLSAILSTMILTFSPAQNYNSLGAELLNEGYDVKQEINHQVQTVVLPEMKKEVKKEVDTQVQTVVLPEMRKEVKKEVAQANKSSGKRVLPIAVIDETPITNSNNFVYLGFGSQSLSVEDQNGYFSEYALDDSAMDIKVGYGQYFNIDEAKLFATGGFEYLSLKQADLKAITASINTETTFTENVTGYIGLKTGLSYLVWDIAQDEAVDSITSTSPLVGVQAGIEYKFDGGLSLVLGGEYTKYFHETEIPKDVLKTNSAYGINISFKFYP